MPNHFVTVGLCAVDWNLLTAQCKQELDLTGLEGANLCKIIDPLPDELRGIISTQDPYRWRHKITGEWSKKGDSPEGDLSNWERVILSDEDLSYLVETYGATTWYEWQSENWGTKWGTYDLKVHEINSDGTPVLIEFQSAWGPPHAEMMRKITDYLHTEYCLTNIKWIGHDPFDGKTMDIEVAQPEKV